MKKNILAILVLFCFAACKKNNSENPSPKVFSDKIILNQPEVIATNAVKLTWSKLDADFDEYLVQRHIDLGPNSSSQETIARIGKNQETTYTDNNVPYKTNVKYFIIATQPSSMGINSNIVTYSRPTANLLAITPFDVLFNKDNNILYFIENSGNISLYDVTTNQITKTINTSATIGYCDIAVYNGKKELYVPRNDGWVFVYDAITLDKIAQLSTSTNASSVVSRSNLLFVSAYNYGSNQPIKVVNRGTGVTISQGNNEDMRRLKYIPNSNNDFLAISPSSYQQVYRFTQFGEFIDIQYPHSSSIGYYADSKMLEFFPDGSKYISSQHGDVFNKNMSFSAKLTANNLTFSTFAFSNNQSTIYAGTTNKTIEAYNIVGYNHLKSYPVSGTPFKIFDLGTQLLCISTFGEFGNVTGTGVEKINK